MRQSVHVLYVSMRNPEMGQCLSRLVVCAVHSRGGFGGSAVAGLTLLLATYSSFSGAEDSSDTGAMLRICRAVRERMAVAAVGTRGCRCFELALGKSMRPRVHAITQLLPNGKASAMTVQSNGCASGNQTRARRRHTSL